MANAIDFIRRQLDTLKCFREDNSSVSNKGEISDIIKKIHDTYLHFNPKIQDREILNAHLFNDQYGVVSYLQSILLLDLQDIKQLCFKLLDDVVEQSGSLIKEYGSNLQDICLRFLERDGKATVKKISLITLSKVLEACQGYQGEKQINVKTVIEKLNFQLSLGSKLVNSVKEEVLILIGVTAHYYPEEFITYQDRALDVFTNELKREITAKSKAPNNAVISGCLLGLKEYLYNFSVLYSEDTENSYLIFDVVYKIIAKKMDAKPVVKAGLQLLAAHAPQFALFIFENCVELFTQLMEWVKTGNREVHKLSRSAVDSILKVTAEMLAVKFHEDETYSTKIFTYFMNEFRDIFVNEEKCKELQIAVMGYGLFAKPCEQCLSEDKVKWMLQNVLLKCEHEFLSYDKIDDKILGLSCYLESLSSIISIIKYIPETTLFSLERICVLQIDQFPKVPSKCSFMVPKSIIMLLLSVQQKEELFFGFLTDIVYQGLVKTCSHPIVVEAEAFKDKYAQKDDNENQYRPEYELTKKIVTYKDYVYLWKNMLNVVQLKELNSLGIPIENRQYLMESLYDELIRSSLNLISKLELSLESQHEKGQKEFQDETIDASSDPLHGVVPKNMTDYYLFINLVDFLRDLLSESCTQLFSKWVFTFGKEMIFYATKYPYHSGFYKLISLDLSICSKIDYFKDYSRNWNESVNSSDQVNDSDVFKSFCLFSKFIREVSIRQQQFKDDLLSSCLQLLLVLPIEIVLKEINILVPALESALKLGVSYLPLADTAVSALEKWSDSIPRDIMKPYFSTILPHLNYYLLVSTIQDDDSSNPNVKRRNTKKVHKMSTKSVKKSKSNALNTPVEDPALLKIQFKIIRFLGRLGESNACLLERAYQKLDEVAIAWDPLHRQHLKYSVPFVDMKPIIFFDDFLPRILEIALKSSVRQVKVGACEALHSLVLFMIGRGSQLPDALQEKYTMEALYKKLFPGLLDLACDVEQVTKQLFTPLVLQIIRWFTCSKVSKTPETAVILLCLWDGVTNNHNAALRDFCAICLKEFFVWSIKQSAGGIQKSTENLLNKLHSFSLHPNPFKRIGAALAFNNIYSHFRREEPLIKKYTIQLLVQFVESLAIAHTDDTSLGTQKQCIIALDHIEKIIIIKYQNFLSASKTAKKPECLEEATLQCAVPWLLRQCGCVQTECRHKCMDLVVKFLPLLPGFKGITSYVLCYQYEDRNIFDDVFEKMLHSFSESNFKEKQSMKNISLWLESLQTTMECYQWSFSKQLMLQNELNEEAHASMLSSVKVFKAIEYYIENFVKESLSSVTKNLEDIYTPEEIFKFNRLKCTVLVRLLCFLSPVFETSAKWFHTQFHQLLWNSSLWEIVLLCAIDPSSLGFDMTDPETAVKLPPEVSSVVKLFSQKKEFKCFCIKYIEHKNAYNIFKNIPINLTNLKIDHFKLIQLLSGYELLFNNGFKSEDIFSSPTLKQKVILSFLDSVWKDSILMDGTSFKKVALVPITFTLAKKMLTLVFLLDFKADTLARRLLNPISERSTKAMGLVIFNVFINNMCTYVAKAPYLFVKAVADNLIAKSNEEMSILLKFVDHIACTKSLRTKNGKDVIEAFLLCWDEILYWWKNHPDGDIINLVLSLLVKLILINSDVALNSSGTFSSSLFSTYHLMLKKSNNSMNFIVSALEAVHFFFRESGDNSDLRSSIEEMIANYFPLQSSELQSNSSAYHFYVSAVKQLLSALSLTGSEDLLEVLVKFFCTEEKHLLEEEFQQSIISMIRRKHPSYHQKFADTVFNLIFSKDLNLKADDYLSIVDKILLLIMEKISMASLINFFLSHIKELLNNVKDRFASGFFLKDISLSKKIGSFKILQFMYQNLTRDLLYSTQSQIVETYLGDKPKTGKELSSAIMEVCLDFKQTSYEMEPEYKDLMRKLNCAKYNTLISVVSCTATDLKFYNAFLFQESPIKKKKIWERIVNCDVKMVFDLEVDSQGSKKRFISIRHKVRSEIPENENVDVESDIPSSLQLFGSNNLAMSSLAEEASKFVFSTKERIFDPPAFDKNDERNSRKAFIEGKHREEFVKIEDDELNRHESMVTLCYLLQHMKSQNLIEENYESPQPPSWVSSIIRCLEQPPENIQLFLGRFITNNAEILSPYARFFIKPLLDLIILGTAGFSLNYYILDVLVTLLSWAPSSIPLPGDEMHKANEVLKFIISNCEHSRKDIFRNNLELIKTILECWKNGLEIPYNIIYEKMKDNNPENKRNIFGIQLLGIIVSSDFPPYDLSNESQGQSYLSTLVKNLSNKFREVYGAAAEVISIVLKFLLKDETQPDENSFFVKVVEKMEDLKKQEDGKFLYCLNKIHFGCPEIADRFISRLLYLFPNMHGNFQNHILEVLCSRANNLRNGYQDLKSINMFDNLEKKGDVVQHISLQTLEKLIPVLSCDDILHILPSIVNIHSQPSSICRFQLFKILFALFEKYSKSDGAKEKEITRYAQETLLIGLADSDPSIRLMIDNFWSDEKRLPLGTKDRILALMKNMFSPVTEESFLQYSTFLLLERTSFSPDFKLKIFEHPLSQCNFQAYQIQTSWRKRHLAMSPLFTESVSSTLAMSMDMMSSSVNQDVRVRATQQNNEFPETIDTAEDANRNETYNWLTGKSLDTFALQDFSYSTYGSVSELSKSHLITFKSDEKTKMGQKTATNEKTKSIAWMLKRRFLKDKPDSDTYARQELRRQDRRKEIQKEQRHQRDAQVVMYRQYRIGELPDIEISNSAIIKPIQALAMHDATVAKILFKSLLVAVCNSVKEECPEGLEVLHKEIGCSFEKILQTSYLYTSPVMSFCLETLKHLQDINFDAETVFNACIGSNLQSIGILLFEAKLTGGIIKEPIHKKRRADDKHVMSEESYHWMKLAELYRSINFYDVVNGIFSLTMGHRENNRKALQHECSGQYMDAVVLYSKLHDQASDEFEQAEKDFWDKSILSCLNKLCKWEELETAVLRRFTNVESPDLQILWEDQYMKDNYMPYLVRSKLKQLLGGKRDQSLLTFFDKSGEEDEKKIHLEMHYNEELSLLYIIQDNLDGARQYCSRTLNRFLKEWQNLSSLSVEMQQSCLQNLVKYVEQKDFLDFMKKNKFVDSSSTINFIKEWKKRFPNDVDAFETWDDVISNRHLYLEKLKSSLAKQKSKLELDESGSFDTNQDEWNYEKLILETSVTMKLRFAENCAAKGNFPVAISTLKTTYNIYKKSKGLDELLWPKFIQAYCDINNKRVSNYPADTKLDVILQSWTQLMELSNKYGENPTQNKILSQTLDSLADMFLKKEINISSMSDNHIQKVHLMCGGTKDSEEIVAAILDKSFLTLKNIAKVNFSSETSKQDQTNFALAQMELANFCNKYLREGTVKGFEPQNIPSYNEFPKILVESLLDALKFGSADALLLFPRLLQIIESYPSVLPLFQEKVSSMPCWLFLGWINQMVAVLDTPEAKAVQNIIEEVALNYPDALYYAFHLSYDSYKFSNTLESQQNKLFVEKVRQILERKTVFQDLVAALGHLSVPHIIFKDYIVQLICLVSSEASEQNIKACFNKMFSTLFDVSERSRNSSVPVGPLQKLFADKYKKSVLEACGNDGSKLLLPEAKDVLTDLLSVVISSDSQSHRKIKTLKEFSPWLNEFQSWKYPTQIEIPGQYTGKNKPLPEYHVKIAGFDEKVLILSSVTLPCRITIRGNDEKEYKILVKSGEDLRQDARIQQIFSVMNDIYANDIHCAQRHLSLKTYKVVPLSTRLGLIEWVGDTAVLMEFLQDGMLESERARFFPQKGGGNIAVNTILKWEKIPVKHISKLYKAFYMNKTRDQCITKFRELESLVPKNLLTRSFTKLSSSPEAFLVLRNKFATSHAVISISQWVIGIGDRHLGNFLIDKTSGSEIGIDFGHAFGSATQFLSTPELVPFRLTPQYQQLMQPLKVKGIYESTMIHALTALCNKKDLLLNVMDIFIKEPTLDWKEYSKKQMLAQGMNPEGINDEWFPKQRISIARKKLEGVNPCYITSKELELGHKGKEDFNKMKSVCLGEPEWLGCVRVKYNKSGLSVEEQVDCLIDLATDPHVLCLTYFGWNPWM